MEAGNGFRAAHFALDTTTDVPPDFMSEADRNQGEEVRPFREPLDMRTYLLDHAHRKSHAGSEEPSGSHKIRI